MVGGSYFTICDLHGRKYYSCFSQSKKTQVMTASLLCNLHTAHARRLLFRSQMLYLRFKRDSQTMDFWWCLFLMITSVPVRSDDGRVLFYLSWNQHIFSYISCMYSSVTCISYSFLIKACRDDDFLIQYNFVHIIEAMHVHSSKENV